jgi:hypothetical protein
MTKKGQDKLRAPRHLMIEIYRIPVSKGRLRPIPKDERVLLLLLAAALPVSRSAIWQNRHPTNVSTMS